MGSFLSFRRHAGAANGLPSAGEPFFGRIVSPIGGRYSNWHLMRMLPVSNVIINAGLALSHVGNRAFLLGSLGQLPSHKASSPSLSAAAWRKTFLGRAPPR